MPRESSRSVTTFSSGGNLKDVSEDYKKLPPLKDVIKSLKDGAYPILRVAFLRRYKYYICETEEWKINLDPAKDEIMGKMMDSLLNSGIGIWVYVRQNTYAFIYKKADGIWQESFGEKADSYVWEGKDLPFIPDGENLDVDWSIEF